MVFFITLVHRFAQAGADEPAASPTIHTYHLAGEEGRLGSSLSEGSSFRRQGKERRSSHPCLAMSCSCPFPASDQARSSLARTTCPTSTGILSPHRFAFTSTAPIPSLGPSHALFIRLLRRPWERVCLQPRHGRISSTARPSTNFSQSIIATLSPRPHSAVCISHEAPHSFIMAPIYQS